MAISVQKLRWISRRCDGAPGDFIGDRPVNSFIQPAGLPINTSIIGVLRRSVESTQFRLRKFVHALSDNGLHESKGRVGACGDIAAMESFFALPQRNVLDRRRWTARAELRLASVTRNERTYHRR